MGYIILNTDRDDEMEGLRSQMRRSYRGGSYRHYGTTPMMRGGEGEMHEHYYKMGYRHAIEDMEDEEKYRRQRDSSGRYM